VFGLAFLYYILLVKKYESTVEQKGMQITVIYASHKNGQYLQQSSRLGRVLICRYNHHSVTELKRSDEKIQGWLYLSPGHIYISRRSHDAGLGCRARWSLLGS
jgi:hypothetical protein